MTPEDAVRKLGDDYNAAHQAGDGEAIAAMFHDDAVIMPPGVAMIEGRSAINAFFAKVEGGAGLKTEVTRIDVRGDLAYDHGTASWSEGGARKFLHYMDVYRLRDGQWKIQLATWNSNSGIDV